MAEPTPFPQRPALSAHGGGRPVGVTVVAVVAFVLGVLLLVAALLVAVVGGTGTPVERLVPGGELVLDPAALWVAVVLLVVVAGLFALVGFGNLRGERWAWWATVVLAGLMLLGGISGLARGDLGGAVDVVASGVALWYYVRPDVREWFHRRAAR